MTTKLRSSDVPGQEKGVFAQRWSRLHEAMATENLDALVISARGVIGQFGNIFYLCGYAPLLRIVYGVLHQGREPILFVPSQNDAALVQGRGIISDVRSSGEMEAQRSATPMAQAVANEVVSAQAKRVGIVGLEQIVPVADYRLFQGSLDDVELVDASGLFAKAKELKTHDDLDGLRAGFALAQLAFDAVPSLLAPRARAQEIVAELERILRSNGGSETLVFVDSSPVWVRRNTDTVLKSGDLLMVLVEVATVDGYFVEQGGLFSLGEPGAEAMVIANACYETLTAIKEMIGPDVPMQAATSLLESVAREKNLKLGFSLGHGIGVDHDLPTVYRSETGAFQTDQVVSVHPHFTHPAGVFGEVADAFYVTDTGCEQLSSLEYKLTVL